MQYELIKLKTIKTPDLGSLSFFEGMVDIPFEMKRIYYIHHVPENGERGGHAHRTMKQLLFCPYGKIMLKLHDGRRQQNLLLDDASKGILLMPGLWRDMVWLMADSVLCVATDQYYDKEDYIRDFNEFLNFVEGGEEGR